MTNEGKKVYVLFGFDQTKFITDCKSILNAFGDGWGFNSRS